MNTVQEELQVGSYDEDACIARALEILTNRVNRADCFTAPQLVKNFLTVRAAGLEYELFSVMFLDSQHRLIAFEEMFRGTLSQTSVYPREVVVRALRLSAAAVILTHNHPSGIPEASSADKELTTKIKSALALVDVRVLDHIITAGGSAVSLAEKGLV